MTPRELLLVVNERIDHRLGREPQILRGVLQRVFKAGGALRAHLELLKDQLEEGDLAQHYGFRSWPPTSRVGVVVVPVQRNGDHRMVVGEIDQDAPELEEGEVLVYTRSGAAIRLSGVLVKLNGGGPKAARVGDTVTITGVDSLGSPITATGTISSGSATVEIG